MHIGDPLIPAGAFGDGNDRKPLDPQTKATLLAQMPFVTDAVGTDIADLGEATPTGSTRTKIRYALGAGLGILAVLSVQRLLRRKSRR